MVNKIIYADDGEGMRNTMKLFFKYHLEDYELESYENGISVEKKLEELAINKNNTKAIVLDNQMELGLTGGELIKKYANKINTPFILAYGGNDEIGYSAIEDGAYAFIKKPFSLKDISNLIFKAIEEYS